MKYEIRELSIGEVLDQAIKVIMDNLAPLILIAFLLQGPLALFSIIGTTFVFKFNPNANDPAALQVMTPAFGMFLAFIGLFNLLIIAPLTNAAMVHAIADAYLGKKLTVGGSFSKAVSRMLPLLGTWLLVFLATFAGTLFCIIPGILCMLWFVLATQVVVLERKAGMAAMERSRELMRGNTLKWIVLLLVLIVIAVGLSIAAAVLGRLTGQFVVRQTLASISQIFMQIVTGAVLVIFYFSARCTNENFDLERLALSFSDDVESGDSMYYDEDDDDIDLI